MVDDIFLKIDKRTIIFLWKGVKCFSGGVRKPFQTIPDGSGRFLIFLNSKKKKKTFQWYTFGQDRNSTNGLKFTKTTIVKRNFQFTLGCVTVAPLTMIFAYFLFRVKKYLDITKMRLVRRWKALMLYFTILISFK